MVLFDKVEQECSIISRVSIIQGMAAAKVDVHCVRIMRKEEDDEVPFSFFCVCCQEVIPWCVITQEEFCTMEIEDLLPDEGWAHCWSCPISRKFPGWITKFKINFSSLIDTYGPCMTQLLESSWSWDWGGWGRSRIWRHHDRSSLSLDEYDRYPGYPGYRLLNCIVKIFQADPHKQCYQIQNTKYQITLMRKSSSSGNDL